MSSWLRANWRHVLTGVVLVVGIFSVRSRAHWLGVASGYASQMALQDRAIEVQREALREAAEDRARREAAADSTRAASEALQGRLAATSRSLGALQDSLGIVRAALAVPADSLEREGLALAARLGQVPADVFRAYVLAIRGVLDNTARGLEAATERATVERARADEAGAQAERERGRADALAVDLRNAGLFAVDLEARHQTALLRIDALENAVRPSFFTNLFGNLELVLLGAGIGALTWEIAR